MIELLAEVKVRLVSVEDAEVVLEHEPSARGIEALPEVCLDIVLLIHIGQGLIIDLACYLRAVLYLSIAVQRKNAVDQEDKKNGGAGPLGARGVVVERVPAFGIEGQPQASQRLSLPCLTDAVYAAVSLGWLNGGIRRLVDLDRLVDLQGRNAAGYLLVHESFARRIDSWWIGAARVIAVRGAVAIVIVHVLIINYK